MAIKVFIDQGHNPQNPNAGAEGNGYREQDIVYTIGVLLAARFNADPDYEARLSRTDAGVILGNSNAESLRLRVSAANAWGADCFLSLHTNAAASPAANGCEGLVYATGTPAYALAEDILPALSAATGVVDRGIFLRPGLYVLRKTAMPAVLLELGFITNPTEAAMMNDRPELFAKGIYDGIVAHLSGASSDKSE